MEWWKVAGYPDLAGINGTDHQQDPPKEPLFAEGLQQYMIMYEANRQEEQERTAAFREYIQRSGLPQVSPPQQ
jgi:hypothetical protein